MPTQRRRAGGTASLGGGVRRSSVGAGHDGRRSGDETGCADRAGIGAGGYPTTGCTTAPSRPAALRNASALSVRSQVKSRSLRPKWP